MVIVSGVIFIIQLLEFHNLFTLVACSTVLGLLSAFHHPIRLVFISLVVPRPYLASAIGLNSVSWNLSRIIGPGLAGLTIHLMGLSETFCIATLFYLPLIVSLYFLTLQPRAGGTTEPASFLKRMIDGGAVALRTPIIFSTLCLVALNSFFVRGVLEIQPAIVGQIMGGESGVLAIVTAAAGFGSLLASGLIGLGKLDKPQIQKALWPMAMLGILTTALLNISTVLAPAVLIFITTGFTATIVGIGAQTLIQLEVQESFRARVMTWWSTISFGGLVCGGTAVGYLGDLVGIDNAIWYIMLFGGVAGLLISPRVQKLINPSH